MYDENEKLVPKIEMTPNEALSAIDSQFLEWCKYEWRETIMEGANATEIDYKVLFDLFSCSLAFCTTLLLTDSPNTLFIPYYFLTTYNVLDNIATTFGIELPPPSGKERL